MKKLLKFLDRKALIFAIIAPLCMLLEVVMDLFQPKLMANIIDIGVANGDLNYVLSVGFKMIVIAVIGLLGGMGCAYTSAIAAMRMGGKLRGGLFSKIQTLSFADIDRLSTSSLITRLTNDVTQVQNMVLMGLRIMVRAPLLSIGGIFMAFSLSAKLSLIFVVAIPILSLVVFFIISKSLPAFSKMQSSLDKVNRVMRESLLGIRVIKAFNIEKKSMERFEEANDDLMEKSISAQSMNIILWPVVTLVMNLGVVAVLWFGGHMAYNGEIEIGNIMAFINYLLQIMGSLTMMVMIMMNYSRAQVSAERINEVLETVPSITDDAEIKKISGYDVEFDNVSFKYNSDSEYVLKDISFKIREGEKIGIIGATGSGKSSLVSLIPRLYDTTSGSVKLGGVDVRNISNEVLRENIGIILQENILFSGSIGDNLKFGKEDASLSEMESAIRDAQGYDFVNSQEEGYEKKVEQRGKNFSGGQKQRLSIARTLIKNPKILILDDSSSALDMETEGKLLRSIKERMKDSTLITIAQRVSAIMDADKIIVLDEGEINAIGTHLELIENCEIYRSIAISQLGEESVLNG